jgi:hypothetical protein
MMRKRTYLLVSAVLFLLTGAAWATLTYIQQTQFGVTIDPPYITRPDGALTATLAVQAESPSRVLATVIITNNKAETAWLYKPLLCVDGFSEEVFFVKSAEKSNLKYQGKHDESYIGDEPGPLPMVHAKENPERYIKLASGATYSSTTNLAELFDFERNRGQFLVSYLAYMPVIVNGKHLLERDTLKVSTNAGPVPVYDIIEPGFNKSRKDYFTTFEVR